MNDEHEIANLPNEVDCEKTFYSKVYKHGLQSELEQLRSIIKKECPDKAKELLGPEHSNVASIPVSSGFGSPVKTLMEPDIRLMNSLSSSQQNFAISNPSLPDNCLRESRIFRIDRLHPKSTFGTKLSFFTRTRYGSE